jgi:hypothetical protein
MVLYGSESQSYFRVGCSRLLLPTQKFQISESHSYGSIGSSPGWTDYTGFKPHLSLAIRIEILAIVSCSAQICVYDGCPLAVIDIRLRNL